MFVRLIFRKTARPLFNEVKFFRCFSYGKLSKYIVAHRGGSKIAPENTRGSLEAAFNKGCKGVEFDLQVTSDKQLVVLHDDTLERTAVPYATAKDSLPETIDEVMHFQPTLPTPFISD